MKRLNKLYEAKAVVSQVKSTLMLSFMRLGFDAVARDQLSPRAAMISHELETLIVQLEDMIIEEQQ